MPGSLRARVLVLGVLTVAGLAGCAGPGRFESVVEVRSAATGEGVAGAVVVAQSLAKDHPLSIDTLLGRTQPEEERAVTDAAGRARVRFVEDRLARVGVISVEQGASMAFVTLGSGGSDEEGWGRWQRPVGSDLLEVRVSAVSGR